jgi:hypothetical protein
MLVKFHSRFGQVLMLGESATALLGLGGHSASIPGAVLAADLPEFLRRLRTGLAALPQALCPPDAADGPTPADESDDNDARPAAVTLRMRAVPFIGLIETAITRQSDLMWERA